MKKLVLVALAMTIGCVAGAVGVERVSAQAPPPTQRWEQICDQRNSFRDLQATVSARGDQGYELVAIDGQVGIVCFKRLH